MSKISNSQSGQVALVALSVTAVLTLLSTMLIQRSVLQQKLSRQSEETARALNQAEAGVEEFLASDLETAFQQSGGAPIEETTAGGVQYRAEQMSQVSGRVIQVGRTRDVDVLGNSNLNYSWTGSGDMNLLVTILGQDGVVRDLHTTNNGSGSKNMNNYSSISPEKVRFKALGDDVQGTVTLNVNGSNLPTQEYTVEAEAQLDSGVSTNVSASQTLPQLPDVFDYALFSGSDINK